MHSTAWVSYLFSSPIQPRPAQPGAAHRLQALRIAIALAGLLLILVCPALAAESTQPRNVLILLAGEYGLPAYDLTLNEIRNTVKARYSRPLNWYAEYMDTARFSKFHEEEAVVDSYERKYGALTIDLLVIIGPNLEPILRRFGDRLFPGTPTLILDILPPDVELPTIFRKPYMTGVFPAAAPQGSIEAALTFAPDTERLVIINGASEMDRLFGKIALMASHQYAERISIQHLSGKPLTEIIAAVEALPDHSVILITAYHVSAEGTAYYTREVTREVTARANGPAYVLFDSNVDVGGVGGHVVSFRKVGREAGRIALRILEGEDPAAIPPLREGFLEYQFDWRQLRRWGIPEDRLPEGSVLLHREVSFFEKYFWLIMGVILFIVSQAVLIAYLLVLNRRQKAMSAQVRQAEGRYRELLRVERSARLGEMAGSLAHELNQPLAAILSSAQAALRFIKSGRMEPDLLREILTHIVDDDKRAASVVSGMRRMLKKGPPDFERLDVNSTVAEAVTLFRGESVAHRTRIEADLGQGIPSVMASKNQLLQVFLNILLNAVQAMASNRGDDRRVVLATCVKRSSVVVSVRDIGPGIAPELIDHLFEPFYTTKAKGMGMGLAVCRSIVEGHGGRLRAMNNLDRGATFTIELPAVSNG